MTAAQRKPGETAANPAWTKDELRRIAEADDLHIAPLREDGATLGTPTWIWCVAVGSDLYVRAFSGRKSRWNRAAMTPRRGRITAPGMKRLVVFEPADGSIDDEIDAVYRGKYAASPYLGPMIGKRAREATVRIAPVPRTRPR